MKISKDQLQQIIKEELEIVLSEVDKFDGMTGKPLPPDPRPAGAKFDGTTGKRLNHAKFFGKPSMPDVNTSRKWKLAPPASGQGSYTRVPNPDYKPVKTALEKGASKLAPLAKGVGRVASRVAPPVAAAATAYDLYKGVTNPDTYTALSQLFGGEEGAYNTWATQQAEAGREVPSYEVYKAKESEMDGMMENLIKEAFNEMMLDQ